MQNGDQQPPDHLIHTETYEYDGPVEVYTEVDESGQAITVTRQKHQTTTVTNERYTQVRFDYFVSVVLV